MSADWVRKLAEQKAASSPPTPHSEMLFVPLPVPASSTVDETGKLAVVEWNFDDVPDEDLWSCLIWEYGRSAIWVHAALPGIGGDTEERQRQISHFHNSRPSTALGILNKMRLWQWLWSDQHGVRQIEFFPNMPWRQLPPIVQSNMRHAVLGLEPVVDLRRLHELLSAQVVPSGEESMELADLMGKLHSVKPPSETEAEQFLASQPSRWLPGGNGCDDVTEGVIRGERFLKRVRNALAKAIAGELSADKAQNLLDEIASGEISLGQLREDQRLVELGYYAIALRINWRMKDAEILAKVADMLKRARPATFRHYQAGSRSPMRGPQGLELYVSRRGGKAKCQPLTALSCLGSWRKFGSDRSSGDVMAMYHPALSGKKYDSQVASYSRDRTDARFLFDQLFPLVQS